MGNTTFARNRSRERLEPSPQAGSTPPLRFRTLLLLVGLSALLRWAGHPPLDFGWLGWVALVPLLLIVRIPPRSHAPPAAEKPHEITHARRDLPRPRLYLAAWLGGLAFWIGALQWLRLGDATMYWAWFALAAYLSLYYPLFLWMTRAAVHGLRLPLWLAAPVAWVGLELLQAHLMTGFAWYHLSHTQYRFLPAIQISDLGGAYLVSFVVLLVNAGLAQCVSPRLLAAAKVAHHPPLITHHSARTAILAAAGALAATFVYGFIRLGQADFTDGPRVALIQGNVPQEVKMDPGAAERIFDEHLQLSRRAVALNGGPPDLLVWPETMFRYPLVTIADGVSDDQLATLAPHRRPASWRRSADVTRRILSAMADPGSELSISPEHGTRLLIGVDARDFEPGETHSYNSAVLVVPGRGVVQRYDKLHLVPFGEYLPLRETFPWLVNFTPFERGYGLDEGTEPTWFELDGYHFATIICFEDTVPHVVRRFIGPPDASAARAPSPLPGDPRAPSPLMGEPRAPSPLMGEGRVGVQTGNGGPSRQPAESSTNGEPPPPRPSPTRGQGEPRDLDFLVNITNDGWFHGSSELDQHLITSAFRAVECRTPLLRAVNTGISAVIDGDGRIAQVARDEHGRSKQVEAVLLADVPLDARGSLYVASGDVFAWSCLALSALGALAGSVLLRRRRKRPSIDIATTQ